MGGMAKSGEWLYGLGGVLGVFLIVYLLAGLRVVYEYQRGVRFTFGRFVGLSGPGLRLVIPGIQRMTIVDLRVRTLDVPAQDCVTKDNISVHMNAVLYYRIIQAAKAVIEVEHFAYAISQLAQTTMRNLVGEEELDELLAEREKLSRRIRQIVDEFTEPWGIEVLSAEIKDVVLPDTMKRMMAKQAEAERERRAVIIRAEGEVVAAENWARAAGMLSAVPGGMHLRTLQTVNDLSGDQSNTVVFGLPLEVLRALEGFGGAAARREPLAPPSERRDRGRPSLRAVADEGGPVERSRRAS